MGGDVEYQALEAFLLSLEICFDGGRKRKKSGFTTCDCALSLEPDKIKNKTG